MKFSIPAKRAISLLLTAIFIITLFGGCGKPALKADNSTSSVSEETVGTTSDDEKENESVSDGSNPSESSDAESDSKSESKTDDKTDSKTDKTEASQKPTGTTKPNSTEKPTQNQSTAENTTKKPTTTAKPTQAEKPTEKPKPQKSKVEMYVDSMTLEQMVGQMFFARCPSSGAAAQISSYHPGGYILFARDFQNQTPASVRKTISGYQSASRTPMLIGVDEEGGTVVRVSKYPAFRSVPFWSPADIYNQYGMSGLVSDTAEKDTLLKSLGINVNLGPVCDVSQNPSDYIYKRTLGKNGAETANCISTIVSQMKKDRMGAVLKHFPGYGSNVDTHTGIAIDKRSIDTFRKNDFLPFIAGIKAGAGGIMINHNIVNCLDKGHPASLSPTVVKTLRNELGFKGVIMTDDLSMSAITKYTDGKNAAVSAVIAGSDMLISSDFVNQYNAVLSAVKNGTISKSRIRQSVLRIVQWKINLGLISL